MATNLHACYVAIWSAGLDESRAKVFKQESTNLTSKNEVVWREEEFEVTKMSSKGQIVIPQEIRDRLNLKEGSKFIAVGAGDTVMLKRLQTPKFNKFEAVMKNGREFAKRHELKQSSVEKAVREYRKEKRR